MQIERQFLNVTSRQVVIELPESFVNHRIELIALTVDEESPASLQQEPIGSTDSTSRPTANDWVFDRLAKSVRVLATTAAAVELGQFQLDTAHFRFDRDEANAR